jgi:hypothetical protein
MMFAMHGPWQPCARAQVTVPGSPAAAGMIRHGVVMCVRLERWRVSADVLARRAGLTIR